MVEQLEENYNIQEMTDLSDMNKKMKNKRRK